MNQGGQRERSARRRRKWELDPAIVVGAVLMVLAMIVSLILRPWISPAEEPEPVESFPVEVIIRYETAQEREAHDQETLIALARTVWGEARGCTTTEQAAVLWCVLNRADRDRNRDELQNRLVSIHNELGMLENENKAHRLKQRQAMGSDEIGPLKTQLEAIRQREVRRGKELEYLCDRKKSLDQDVTGLRSTWNEIDGETFSGGNCPTCGQPLPQDRLEKAMAGFELDKEVRKKSCVQLANTAKKTLAAVQKDIDRLMEGIALAESGSRETNMLVDAIMAQTALTYGEPVEDEDTGERIGYRVKLPMFSVSETLKKYEVRTRRDNAEKEYVVGVMLRGQEE